MRPEERDPKLLWDMLDAAKAIQEFTRGIMWIQYSTSNLLQSAVERKLEIIGEASRGISTTFREAHPEIPWRMMISQRNVIAHEYGKIKQEKLWLVATESIPALIAALEPLIPPIEDIDL